MPTDNERGQAIFAAIALVLVLLIVVPALVSMVVTESRWTVREKQVSSAYYLAEAGIERGFWKLQDEPTSFDLLSSATIAGYDFDVAYADVPSTSAPAGVYTVRLSSYSVFGSSVSPQVHRVITASGRDKAGETATIELLVQPPGVVRAPFLAQVVGMSGNGRIHWGPVMSLSSMSFVGASVLRWPRKYARGAISAGPNNTDLDPAQPNYDTDNPAHSEFWSFNEPPGVPDPPTVDIAYYRALAQCSSCAVAAGYPGGGVYFASNTVISNQKDLQPRVRFAEGTLKFTGCVATMGVTISMGYLDLAGGACNVGQIPGRYPQTVNIPDSAWMDYRKIDTAASGEYPGDLGGPGSGGLSPTYTFGAGSNTNTQTTLTMSHFGFLYALANWRGIGGTVIVGAVMAPNDDGTGSGGVRIYYQDDLNIRGGGGTQYQRATWDRKPAYWPPGLP